MATVAVENNTKTQRHEGVGNNPIRLAAALLLTLPGTAAALEWSGLSTQDDNWSTSGNWLCVACGGPDDDGSQRIDFGGAAFRDTPFVDQPANIAGIRFEAFATSYFISGLEITIGAEGVRQNSSSTQFIANNIVLSADQTWDFGNPDVTPSLRFFGDVDLNGNHLTIGNLQQDLPRLNSNFPPTNYIPPSRVLLADKGLKGSGDVTVRGLQIEGDSNYDGNMYLTNGSDLLIQDDGSLTGNIDVRFSGLPSDGINDSQFKPLPSGIFRVSNGGFASVDRVTAENDIAGFLIIEQGSTLELGAGNSSFTMNAAIIGDGAADRGELIKVGTGSVSIDTNSYDADLQCLPADPGCNTDTNYRGALDPRSATAPVTIVREGRLSLIGNNRNSLQLRTEGSGELFYDIGAGQSNISSDEFRINHSILGDGTVVKSGVGTLLLETEMDVSGGLFGWVDGHTGVFDVRGGQLKMGVNNALGSRSTLRIDQSATVDLNGRTVAIGALDAGQVAIASGYVDTEGSVLTIGVEDLALGNNSISRGNIVGDGLVIKTGLDSLNMARSHSNSTANPQFTGTLRVEQGAVEATVTEALSNRMTLEMAGGELNLNGNTVSVGQLQSSGNGTVNLEDGTFVIGSRNNSNGASRAANLSGTGTVVKQGLDNLVIEGTNTYAGDLAIRQATVSMGNDNALNSNIAVDIDGGNLELAGTSQDVRQVTFSGAGALDTTGGRLAIGQRNAFNATPQAALTGNFSGNGTLVKQSFDDMQIGTLANFSGRIEVSQGILTTSRDNGLQSSVDVDVTDGGTILGNPRTALMVDHQQGFGAISGNGLIDFSNGSISIGNGDKSGVFNGTLRSSRGTTVVKNGSGKITLNGELEYRGNTRINDGELEINGNFMDNGGSVSLFAGSSGNPVVSGSGVLERISGTGLVSPGEGGRAGILTTANLNLGGLDFAFELSESGPNFLDLDRSLSDVLRITENVSGGFNSTNEINLYLDITELSDGDTLAGGLFTRFPGQFLNPELAQFNIFIEDATGGTEFNGRQWTALNSAAWDVSVTSTFTRARFQGESTLSNGYLTEFSFGAITVVPIPGAVWLFASGIGLLGWFRRRR